MSRIDGMTDEQVQEALGEVYGAIDGEERAFNEYVRKLEEKYAELRRAYDSYAKEIGAVHDVLDGIGVPRKFTSESAKGKPLTMYYTAAGRVAYMLSHRSVADSTAASDEPVLIKETA